MALCSLHSLESAFFVMAMKIDLLGSSGRTFLKSQLVKSKDVPTQINTLSR